MAQKKSNYANLVGSVALAIAAGGGLMYGLTPDQGVGHVYFGLLHAHTLISDGSGTPEEAYKAAKDNKLDFFAVTPHNHADAEDGAKERKDGIMIATDQALYNGTSVQTITRHLTVNGQAKTEQMQIKPLLMAAKEATTPTFVALYGQEFSTISSGNHMNVLGIDQVITVANGDYKGLIDLVKKTPGTLILQMNHPDVHEDLFYHGTSVAASHLFNDYGVDEGDLGPDFKDLSQTLNPFVCLVEVLSGPAMKEERQEHYHYSTHENDYFFYLKEGFRVSPSAGQDNHYKTWGSVTDARTGVVAAELTQASLFDAMQQRKTFATEDKNLQAILFVNDAVMGSAIKATEGGQLKLNVQISDADEPATTYSVEVYGGEITPQPSKQATEWKEADGKLGDFTFSGNGTFTTDFLVAQGKPWFYYVKLTEDDGDRLWTAPVWVNTADSFAATTTATPTQVIYYWSKSPSSKVYHVEGCSTIRQIKPENLESGPVPPSGRTLHDCHVEQPAEP